MEQFSLLFIALYPYLRMKEMIKITEFMLLVYTSVVNATNTIHNFDNKMVIT